MFVLFGCQLTKTVKKTQMANKVMNGIAT